MVIGVFATVAAARRSINDVGRGICANVKAYQPNSRNELHKISENNGKTLGF